MSTEVAVVPLKDAVKQLNPGVEKLIKEYEKEFGDLKLHGPTDITMYETIKEAHLKFVRPLRTDLEAKRKELKQPAIDYGKAIDEEAKRLTALITPLEEKLVAQRKVYEDEEKRLEEAKEQARLQKIRDRNTAILGLKPQVTLAGYTIGNQTLAGQDVEHMTDSDFSVKYELMKDERDRLEAENLAQRTAQEAQNKELEELRRMKADMEALKERELVATQTIPDVEDEAEFDPFEDGQSSLGNVPASVTAIGADSDEFPPSSDAVENLAVAALRKLWASPSTTEETALIFHEGVNKVGNTVQYKMTIVRSKKKFGAVWSGN